MPSSHANALAFLATSAALALLQGPGGGTRRGSAALAALPLAGAAFLVRALLRRLTCRPPCRLPMQVLSVRLSQCFLACLALCPTASFARARAACPARTCRCCSTPSERPPCQSNSRRARCQDLSSWLLSMHTALCTHHPPCMQLEKIRLVQAWLRVALGYHTSEQVAAGAALGCASAAAWHRLGAAVALPALARAPAAECAFQALALAALAAFGARNVARNWS